MTAAARLGAAVTGCAVEVGSCSLEEETAEVVIAGSEVETVAMDAALAAFEGRPAASGRGCLVGMCGRGCGAWDGRSRD